MPKREIDWDTIHKRMAVSSAAISGTLRQTQVEINCILESRARAAAFPLDQPDETENLEILAFSLAGEAYGVETTHIHEVCQLKDLTPLPGTPPFIAGVMNLRGRILAVIDLREFFGLPDRGLTELNQIVVLKSADSELALLADAISGVTRLPVSDLQEGLPTLGTPRKNFLKGVSSRMLAVLDGARLLADAQLKVNQSATRQIC